MAREGGSRTGEDDMLVVAKLRSTVDKGRTDRGAGLGIGGDSVVICEGI